MKAPIRSEGAIAFSLILVILKATTGVTALVGVHASSVAETVVYPHKVGWERGWGAGFPGVEVEISESGGMVNVNSSWPVTLDPLRLKNLDVMPRSLTILYIDNTLRCYFENGAPAPLTCIKRLGLYLLECPKYSTTISQNFSFFMTNEVAPHDSGGGALYTMGLDRGGYIASYLSLERGTKAIHKALEHIFLKPVLEVRDGTITSTPQVVALESQDFDSFALLTRFESNTQCRAVFEIAAQETIGGSSGSVQVFLQSRWEVKPLFTLLPATVDIDPDTLNLKSRGKWITCYIELPKPYNVKDIDATTVKLIINGTAVPAESRLTGIGDYDDDSTSDLMVKFDRKAVEGLIDDNVVTMVVRGEVARIPFEGSDTIRVIKNSPALDDLTPDNLTDQVAEDLSPENLAPDRVESQPSLDDLTPDNLTDQVAEDLSPENLAPDRVESQPSLDKGARSPRRRLSAGSGLTALHQAKSLGDDEVAVCYNGDYLEIPGVCGILVHPGLENRPTMSSGEENMLGFGGQAREVKHKSSIESELQ